MGPARNQGYSLDCYRESYAPLHVASGITDLHRSLRLPGPEAWVSRIRVYTSYYSRGETDSLVP